MSSAVVLLSGGQDSTTCLYWALVNFDKVHALSVHYGQRHESELAAAADIAELAECASHDTVSVDALSSDALAYSPLVNTTGEVSGTNREGIAATFVPGRNIVLLSLAAALAYKLEAHDIVTGVCQTDYSGYPDCRRDTIDAMGKTLELGLDWSPLRIATPLMWLTKAETVRLALRLPGCMDALAHTVTCYHGKQPGCGECPACELRIKGFEEAGVEDPALIAVAGV